MDSDETNLCNMITTVIEYSDGNAVPVAGVTLYGTTLTQVKHNMVAIGVLNGLVTATTKGITKDTIQLRTIMTNFGLQCASAIYAYANSLTPVNHTLAESVNYNQSQFDRMPKEKVDDVCAVIQGVANTNILLLGPVGITAPIVTAFGVSINDYSASIQKPRNAIVNKKTAKEDMTTLIRSTVDVQLIKVMDRLVISLKVSQPKFFKGYFSAREIIDAGSTFTKFRGNAHDKDGNAMQNVVATLVNLLDATLVYTSKTNNLGNFKNVVVKPGDYDITYVCVDFETQTELEYHFKPGSETIHKIVMVAVVPPVVVPPVV